MWGYKPSEFSHYLQLKPSAGDSKGTLQPSDLETAAVSRKQKGERSRDSDQVTSVPIRPDLQL